MADFQLIENSIELIETKDFFDKIAFVAHNCYQVADKGHDANIDFVKRLIQSGHLAMIEHYRFTFEVSEARYHAFKELYDPYYYLTEALIAGKKHFFVTSSLRPLLEATGDDAKALAAYLSGALPEEVRVLTPYPLSEEKPLLADPDSLRPDVPKEVYDAMRFVTYHLITDRGVTHEIVRHRPCSFAQESTRYCNYTKDKFSHELTFMKPLRYDEFKPVYDAYFQKTAETYFALITAGEKPDEARAVLPNSLKASIMVSADVREWKHIFELRCSEYAHPDIRRLMTLVRDDMGAKGIL